MQYGRFAQLYDVLMSDIDRDMWGEYLESFLAGRDRVTDCACGTGEMTLRIARAGHTVTGTDISQDMLFEAQNKARSQGMKIPFVCMDMEKLSVHRPQDAVVCACDGVNYLCTREKVQRFFASASGILKQGGLLLFDVSTRYKLSAVLGNNTFAFDDGERAYIWQNVYDDVSKLIEMQLSFFVKKGELYERFTETHIQRAHSVRELKNALEAAGFTDIAVYDAFTREEAKDNSERVQFAAVKA